MGLVKTSLIRIDSGFLGNCKALDEKGDAVELKTLWSAGSAILVFLRHFACVACRAHATQVWSDREKYEKGGARIHFIGNGTPSYILRFKEDLGIMDASILTDPSLESFRAAGFRKGFLASHGPRSMVNGAKLLAQGHQQKLPGGGAGSVWQLGGIIVVKPDGKVAYQYVSEALGDFPPEKDIESLGDMGLSTSDVATVTG